MYDWIDWLRAWVYSHLALESFSPSAFNSGHFNIFGLSRAAWVAKLAGAAITWYSKKLTLTATSSAEAEYKALSEGAKEAMWAKNVFEELRLPIKPIRMHCDNTSAMQMSKNPVQHHKSRHFKLAWHYVRQLQEAGELEVEYVKTALQDADILTKALSASLHKTACARIGLVTY